MSTRPAATYASARVHEPQAPALYLCDIAHARARPLRHSFRHRTYLWLTDLDRPPRLPWPLRPLARFEARDHFGGTAWGIRAGLERFLAERGVDLAGGRVLMLCAARVLGYVFNPLTLYWCYRGGDNANDGEGDNDGEGVGDGGLECVVAEVHNTYGQRHCYLLRPGRDGWADVDKEFYVSPFFPVDGRYRMRLPVPGERLDLTVHLERGEQRPFTASVRGWRRPATLPALLRTAARHPWPTLAVAAGIRLHGGWLWLRGLPVRPRPRDHSQKGMQ